jgi:hypothetical protein
MVAMMPPQAKFHRGCLGFSGARAKKDACVHSLVVLCLLIVLSGTTARSQPANGCASSTVDDSPSFGVKRARAAKAFLLELQQAVEKGEAKKIAGMVRYPLTVPSGRPEKTTAGGQIVRAPRSRMIRTRAEFLAQYSAVVTAEVKKSVLEQKADCLFGNWQGVMVGNGEIWFDQRPGPAFKIVTINVPKQAQ